MKLKEFIKSHDRALAASDSILETVRDGNKRLGTELIDSDEVMAELSIIFNHIETLEEMAVVEIEVGNGKQKNVQ